MASIPPTFNPLQLTNKDNRHTGGLQLQFHTEVSWAAGGVHALVSTILPTHWYPNCSRLDFHTSWWTRLRRLESAHTLPHGLVPACWFPSLYPLLMTVFLTTTVTHHETSRLQHRDEVDQKQKPVRHLPLGCPSSGWHEHHWNDINGPAEALRKDKIHQSDDVLLLLIDSILPYCVILWLSRSQTDRQNFIYSRGKLTCHSILSM